MQISRRTLVIGLLLGSVSVPARAQVGEGAARRRNQTGGVNNAPPPGVFTVVSVDTYGQTVSLKAKDGSVNSVYVSSDIYDISTLKAGDRIRVDFIVPDAMNPKPAAASIWPVK
jgi:hypothetical protein